MSALEGFQRSDPKDDDATKRAKRIHNHMMYCQHYDGMAIIRDDGKCHAGVRYDDIGGNSKERPCIGGHNMPNALQLCPKWVRNTLEMGVQRHEEIEGVLGRMRVVGPVVSKWRTWTKKNRVAKQEAIDCPTGCGGKLHLSQAAYNGHVWGKCTTEGCVSWME